MIFATLLATLTAVQAQGSPVPEIKIPGGTWKPLRQDYFASVCVTALSTNALILQQCPLSLQEPVYDPYYACLCNSKDLVLSLFQCMYDSSLAEGTGLKSIADSWDAFEGYCSDYKAKPLYTAQEAADTLHKTPITISYDEANSTLTGPFLTSPLIYDQLLMDSGVEYHDQLYYAELFGLISMWYLFGIMFIQAVIHWSAYILPGFVRVISNNPLSRQLRRHVVLPAMFKKSRADPVKFMRYFLLCFPPRLHAVFFAGYLLITIVGTAFHYHEVVSPYFYASGAGYVGGSLAWRSGQLAMYKMPLIYLFAGRNNILIWLTGWQFEIFNHWHRWISRLFFIDVIIHAIAYSIDFVSIDYYTISYKDAYWNWGFVATFMIAALCVNGTKTMRALSYEVFLYLHIVMAVFCVIGTYYHVIGRAGLELIWPCVAFWGFDRAVRLARIILAGGPMAKAHVLAHPNNVLEITINYSGFWKTRAGSYVFVHFLCSPLYAFQSHPFTCVDNGNPKEFKLYCRVHNGVTSKLYRRAQAQGGEYTCRVLVEGAYGVEFATKLYKDIVLFAGGIGITAVYSHAKHIAANATPEQVIYVHWAIANKDPLNWFSEELNYLNSLKNVKVIIHLNDAVIGDVPDELSSIEPQKEDSTTLEKKSSGSSDGVSIRKVNLIPDFNAIIVDHIVNSQGAIVFFVCGPAPMSDTIRQNVAKNLLKVKNYVQYYEESFSM